MTTTYNKTLVPLALPPAPQLPVQADPTGAVTKYLHQVQQIVNRLGRTAPAGT